MTLKRIELWNIRCHEHFKFEPDETGITAVSGGNGAGKSTIVDAFAWALYGTKTNNIKNKMLIREGISPKTNEVKVEVELRVNKIDYLIKRAIVGEGGGSDCNVYGRSADSPDTEYNHLAGPAISSAEAFIKQILKMDEKGFLTAVLIQQKQVDQIVAASPRERGEVIEKLTGIQSISNAITLAKDEARTCQRAANVITVQDTESLAKVINESISTGKALKLKSEEASDELDSFRAEVLKAQSHYKNQELLNVESKELRQKVNIDKELLKVKEAESVSLMSIIEEYKKETKTIVAEDAKVTEGNLRDANRLVAENQSQLNQVNNSIRKYLSELNSLESKVGSAELEEVNAQLIKHEERHKELSSSIDKLNDELQNLKGEEKQVKKSLDTLSEDVTECPVCKSHIDEPEALRVEIDSELEGFKSRRKEIKKDVTSLSSDLTGEVKACEHTKQLQSAIARHDELVITINELKEEGSRVKGVLEDYEARVVVLDKQYKEALQIASKADEVNRAKQRIIELNNELSQAKKLIELHSEKLEKSNSLGDRALAGLRNKLDEMQRTLNRMEIEYNKDVSHLNYLRERVTDLKAQYSSAKDANDKYNKLIRTMKHATVASSLMSEFKENRIKVSIPALEMYASTILSKFTDGKFIKLQLDSKFNTFVTTDSGKIRPIAQLSGGELSAAAIALRIGISMLLNDGENNVLILDEILVSMDDVRARHIIETITSIINCQVIFIAHNTDIQSIADKTIQV